jgi:hypothetical protein
MEVDCLPYWAVCSPVPDLFKSQDVAFKSQDVAGHDNRKTTDSALHHGEGQHVNSSSTAAIVVSTVVWYAGLERNRGVPAYPTTTAVVSATIRR